MSPRKKSPPVPKIECIGGPYDGEWLPVDRDYYRVVSHDEAYELGRYVGVALPHGIVGLTDVWWWVRTEEGDD